LVAQVDHVGFGLHLDAGSLHTAHEELAEVLAYGLPRLCHYHVSEPELTGFSSARVPHLAWLRLLRTSGYQGWASIEVDATTHALDHTLVFAADLLRCTAAND
jgi:sugar phosphate isomerase/epimerase